MANAQQWSALQIPPFSDTGEAKSATEKNHRYRSWREGMLRLWRRATRSWERLA